MRWTAAIWVCTQILTTIGCHRNIPETVLVLRCKQTSESQGGGGRPPGVLCLLEPYKPTWLAHLDIACVSARAKAQAVGTSPMLELVPLTLSEADA